MNQIIQLMAQQKFGELLSELFARGPHEAKAYERKRDFSLLEKRPKKTSQIKSKLLRGIDRSFLNFYYFANSNWQ